MNVPEITDVADSVRGSMRNYHSATKMAQGGREDKLGGRDGCWDGISGVVLGLRRVSAADGYLWIPLQCEIYGWTGSLWGSSSQDAVGLNRRLQDVIVVSMMWVLLERFLWQWHSSKYWRYRPLMSFQQDHHIKKKKESINLFFFSLNIFSICYLFFCWHIN